LDEAGLIADQLKESLENPNVITVIEWSEIVKGVLPHERYIIELRPLRDSPDERLVIFNYPQSKERLVRKMQVAVAEL
jgi:tRNA A37 threonylcarbamoyladenosine biosynthesis protein TsaE